MANKRKPTTKKRDPDQITAPQKPDEERAVAIARFPPDGMRGASLARCTDYGLQF